MEKALTTANLGDVTSLVSQLAPRLIGDHMNDHNGNWSGRNQNQRVMMERESFVLGGGVEIIKRVFRDPVLVCPRLAEANDARKLDSNILSSKFAKCWNEALIALREIIFALPDVVVKVTERNFLPFLFTLLAHDDCFDGAAALIEEVLSIQSQNLSGSVAPSSTFFLGEIPDLYNLWASFTCRQLAHFCRIMALLVFEPEDRQLMEYPAVLKSVELLQLRRDRASRVGRDVAVDCNQAICLGDENLVSKLVKLLRVMNFAPDINRGAAYHVMAHFPWIADTLVMLGLIELESWDEIDYLEQLARSKHRDGATNGDQNLGSPSSLGVVGTMLESLVDPLLRNTGGNSTHLGHIIDVISAAQRAGVVASVSSSDDQARIAHAREEGIFTSWPSPGSGNDSGNGARLNSSILNDLQRLVRDGVPQGRVENDQADDTQRGSGGRSQQRQQMLSPDEAANQMQFNALLLAPYQVEILFVLCTLLGGRRKIDAQRKFGEAGLLTALDDMFNRLSWGTTSAHNSEDFTGQQQQNGGIHGPGCECNPESALRVQYLRLLHNLCDRDCDNYGGRRLLLSPVEREYIFAPRNDLPLERPGPAQYGLLSKVIDAFVNEPDDSPYKFWLASCAESYFRGSSPSEQLFAAQSGLLNHLVSDVLSERLHCAGSLQTSFDLLGELCKGNKFVLKLLFGDLDEFQFRKLMSVAANNLVDSNVFIRALMLSVEHIMEADVVEKLNTDKDGTCELAYLSHTWWDTPTAKKPSRRASLPGDEKGEDESTYDGRKVTEWFIPAEIKNSSASDTKSTDPQSAETRHFSSLRRTNSMSVGDAGWVFTPFESNQTIDFSAVHSREPSIGKLVWFLTANRTRLLRDLLSVVELKNINHENICCLNTAVVVAIFASRHNQLEHLIDELRWMNEGTDGQCRRTSSPELKNGSTDYDNIDGDQSIHINFDQGEIGQSNSEDNDNVAFGARDDILRNFRELLWFWKEYYTNRGRDRLSLEFSSHLRFVEWKSVVSKLCLDDGSRTALSSKQFGLPKSPYKRSPRSAESRWRGE